MNENERQKLCEALRGKRPWPGALAKMMPDAAGEIERLVQELSHREIDIEIQRNEIERLVKMLTGSGHD